MVSEVAADSNKKDCLERELFLNQLCSSERGVKRRVPGSDLEVYRGGSQELGGNGCANWDEVRSIRKALAIIDDLLNVGQRWLHSYLQLGQCHGHVDEGLRTNVPWGPLRGRVRGPV